MNSVFLPVPDYGITYGPVPSRRLGRSLGVNIVPPKFCNYSCVYCQVGVTTSMIHEPHPFYDPDRVTIEIHDRLDELTQAGTKVDFIALVPDGEPTLDANLGTVIRNARAFDVPVAVITNGTLLDRADVRASLGAADWVSVKIDTVDEETWRSVNRPHGALSLATVLDGIRRFRDSFDRTFVTETMLVAGRNTDRESLTAVAEFVASIQPESAYLAVPTRPPAVADVRRPAASVIADAHLVFAQHLDSVDLLTGYEGNNFTATGDAERDLLAITAVHPMRQEAVSELLVQDKSDWSVVVRLLSEKRLARASFGDHTYYTRAV